MRETGGFKVKLVAYFVLLAFVPLAAVFWGFTTIAAQSETRQADARLQASLRAAVGAYESELATAQATASRFASRADVTRALTQHDAEALARLVRPGLRVVAPGFTAGVAPRGRAASRSVAVYDAHGVLGRVVAYVPLDPSLARMLAGRIGLMGGDRLVLVHGSAPSLPQTVRVDGTRYRAVAAPPLEVLTPQSRIDAASSRTEERLLVALLATLLLVAVAAWLEGRTIVRSVRRLVRAANAIAAGDLSRRVSEQGHDELTVLAHSFNDMAAQLQARLGELESERGRLQDAIALFGAALAATHDVDQLLRVVLDGELEATGATGGIVIVDGSIAVQAGVFGGDDRIEVPLRAGK